MFDVAGGYSVEPYRRHDTVGLHRIALHSKHAVCAAEIAAAIGRRISGSVAI